MEFTYGINANGPSDTIKMKVMKPLTTTNKKRKKGKAE